MKEGYCILYRYEDGYRVDQPPFNPNNKKCFIKVCDIPTAINEAMEYKNGFSRIVYNNEKCDVFIDEFMFGNLIFSNNLSNLLNIKN